MYNRKPDWLKGKVSTWADCEKTAELLKSMSLNTVCEHANCPNITECYGNRTATFLILGNNCTRNCTFCQVQKGHPQEIDHSEPEHVANAVRKLDIKHVVITSVTRDDLPDGGACHFAETIKAIRTHSPEVTIEVLIPDLQGNQAALCTVISAMPDVINHNIETVERLYPQVRPMAVYTRSLELLKSVKTYEFEIATKSGIMVGLGETTDEVLSTMQDLHHAACDILTIGQYLAPSKLHYPITEYIHPDMFEIYKSAALQMGFRHVVAGPYVRSSYQAGNALEKVRGCAEHTIK